MKVGILNTGKMGTSLGIAAQANGHQVLWASDGRSEESRRRAEENEFTEVITISRLSAECDVIVSICMGAGVMPNAKAVIDAEFRGIFVDANHIGDVAHENHLSEMLRDAGIDYVDASIYGWPYPHENDPHGERTLYLFGEHAGVISEVFAGEIFDRHISDVSAKEIKRQREINDRRDCMPNVDHGYGVVEFRNAVRIDNNFIDQYMHRRELCEPLDYTIDEDGFYVNRGGYRFTKAQIEEAPRRYLNLITAESPEEDVAFYRDIETAISKCINAYRGIYPEVYDCVRWRTDAHIACYPPGAGMGMHHDNAIGKAGKNENPIFNVLSMSLILSDRCEGGELELKYANKVFKPENGTLIIYPAGFLGSHAVRKVTSGLRISYLEFFGHGSVSGQTKPI